MNRDQRDIVGDDQLVECRQVVAEVECILSCLLCLWILRVGEVLNEHLLQHGFVQAKRLSEELQE